MHSSNPVAQLKYLSFCLSLALIGCGSGAEGGGAESLSAGQGAMVAAEPSFPRNEILDVSKDACGRQHPLVGQEFQLSTRSHGVSGKVRIIDDCTFVVSDFNYDGKGVQVEIYGSVGGSFENGLSLSGELLRRGMPYENAQLLVRLPPNVSLSSIDGLSVWCKDVNVSFGDLAFPAR